MFNKRNILLLATSTLLAWGCQKIVHGYLSDRIFYQVNPFVVQQGVTTVSSSLVADGSTEPLHVKVISLKDSLGNDADSILNTPRNIVTYTGTLTPADSTIALLNAKLKDSSVRPFNIAEIGGRLQFTAATTYVPAGTYNMDLLVSNIRGSETLKNACQINITPLTNTYNAGYYSFRAYDSEGNQVLRTDADPAYATFDITYDDNGTNQIILKFVDKNGVPFNPKLGEVSDYSNDPIATTYYPKLHYWAPYYPAVYTDSTIIQELPNVDLSFPYFSLPNYPVSDGARIDNKITGVQGYGYVQTVMYFTLLTQGTYHITYHMVQNVHE